MHDPKDSIKEGYEVTDMNIRLILISLAGLALMTITGFITIIIVMRGFEESRGPLNTGKASPLAAADSQRPPEGPILQQDPVADKVVVLEAAFAQLGSYGVVSDTPGHERMHIPIHRAVELVGEGTVPYRQAPVTAALSEARH
jgi:hypothetical protein